MPVRYLGDPPDINVPAVKRGLLLREADAIDASKIPGATLRNGTLEVPAN